ncbi:MAG: CUAEP/CCAEP-tail radical SAM protein [Bryobacteraceae bacterium]
MRVLLISTYELGRQPFGLASPAAMLEAAGHTVECTDASLDPVSLSAVERAGLIAFHLPMHTATRLASGWIPKIRAANPRAHLCGYGLYAPLNAEYLRGLGVHTLIGGEFERALCDLAAALNRGAVNQPPLVTLDRVEFAVPRRDGLPPLERYARLVNDGRRLVAGYTEASRGCKHLCRHCPVVPVYRGKFRVVPVETVLDDAEQQVASGARHITFGDPDFFNGPGHARRIIEAFPARFAGVTYDVTIKIEHLLRHRDLLPMLARTGCAFVTSAVESVDDAVLERLDKGHTRADFLEAAALCREAGVPLSPTFIPFTPWTTLGGYRELLATIAELGLVKHVAPVQFALRLLIPNGSLLLDLNEVRARVERFDPASLTWRWRHPDPEVDRLAEAALRLVDTMEKQGASRETAFTAVWKLAHGKAPDFHLPARAAIPYLTEPWYC